MKMEYMSQRSYSKRSAVAFRAAWPWLLTIALPVLSTAADVALVEVTDGERKRDGMAVSWISEAGVQSERQAIFDGKRRAVAGPIHVAGDSPKTALEIDPKDNKADEVVLLIDHETRGIRKATLEGKLVRDQFKSPALFSFDASGQRLFAMVRGQDKVSRVRVFDTQNLATEASIELGKDGRHFGRWLMLSGGDQLVGFSRVREELMVVDTGKASLVGVYEMPRKARGADVALFARNGQPWVLATFTYNTKVNDRDPRTMKLAERDRMDGMVLSLEDGSVIWEGRLAFEPTWPIAFDNGFLVAGRRNYGTDDADGMYIRKVTGGGVETVVQTDALMEPGGLAVTNEGNAFIAGDEELMVVDLDTGEIANQGEMDFHADAVLLDESGDKAYATADYGSKVAQLDAESLAMIAESSTGRTGVKVGQVFLTLAQVATYAYTGYMSFTRFGPTSTEILMAPEGDALYVFNARTQDLTSFSLPDFRRVAEIPVRAPFIPFSLEDDPRLWVIAGEQVTALSNGTAVEDASIDDVTLLGFAADSRRVYVNNDDDELVRIDLDSAAREVIGASKHPMLMIDLSEPAPDAQDVIVASYPRAR